MNRNEAARCRFELKEECPNECWFSQDFLDRDEDDLTGMIDAAVADGSFDLLQEEVIIRMLKNPEAIRGCEHWRRDELTEGGSEFILKVIGNLGTD